MSFVGTKKPTLCKTRPGGLQVQPRGTDWRHEPLGFFDPSGFCKDEVSFKDLRAKALKHGRTFVLKGDALFEDTATSLAVVQDWP